MNREDQDAAEKPDVFLPHGGYQKLRSYPMTAPTTETVLETRRQDRLLETTTSLCAVCRQRVEAHTIVRAGAVYVLKHCPIHGEQLALLEKNAAYYLGRLDYDKPGTVSKTQTLSLRGCPYDCGLCPNHQQHTCIGLIEVTGQCNLDCPDCYARPRSPRTLSLEEIARMMDFFQDAEAGKAEVLQISGGEPTLHPRILEILRLAKAKRFKCVMLNTNGLRCATDEPFVQALAELAGGFEVYLQFDGFERQASEQLRGADVVALKEKAVAHLSRHRVPTTLVATIEQGANDHELGRLIQFGLNAECVRGINFQPIAFFRADSDSAAAPERSRATERTTVTEILERIEAQTAGTIRLKDFVPLPCDVERVAITYLHRSQGGFTPITRGADLRRYLPLIPNTFAFEADDLVAQAPAPVTAAGCCETAATLLRLLRPLIPKSYAAFSPAQRVQHVSQNTFRISVSSFVDPYNFDLRSMQRECVHVITPDLRRIPFSAYNMFHREP